METALCAPPGSGPGLLAALQMDVMKARKLSRKQLERLVKSLTVVYAPGTRNPETGAAAGGLSFHAMVIPPANNVKNSFLNGFSPVK